MGPELAALLILVTLLGSAFAAGSETALVSASRLRLHRLDADGRRGAKTALRLVDERDRILAVTLVATNTFHITGGAVATATLESWLGSRGPVLATVIMTCLFLLLSEIVPKAYFRHHADRMLVSSAAIWRVLSWVSFPVTYPAEVISGLLFRLFKREPRSPFTSREEIKLLLVEAVEDGGLRHHEQEMLESALVYAETVVREVMVPISEVMLLPETASRDEILTLIRECGYTRIPIFQERVDRIVGLVNIYDLLFDGQGGGSARTFMRPVRLVPDTKRIDGLFLEMQQERESLAVVVNEFGACIGIVSTEDIIEEIFGELSDEHEDTTPDVQELGPGRFLVNARLDIEDFNDMTGLRLVKAGYQTVAGYVLQRLGRVPFRGHEFTDGKLTIRVTDADRYGVKQVEVVDGARARRRQPPRTSQRGEESPRGRANGRART